MKKYLFMIVFIGLFYGCNNDKQEALKMLDQARIAYEESNFLSANNALDSLKIKYPKEVEVLKEGLGLRRQVELGINEKNIVYYDSMMIVKQAEADSMKKLFVFEKNPKFDEIGKYIDKQQTLERNINRTYIRSGVNELGQMYIASVYHGAIAIHHKQLKVSASSNEYAETNIIPEDGGTNYSFKDLGTTTEVVTYQNGKDDGLIRFIYEKRDLPLKAELLGGTKYQFTINSGDIKSLAKTYDFSIILSDIERLKLEKTKANTRIQYLKSKLEAPTE